jgi:hypothetical protein
VSRADGQAVHSPAGLRNACWGERGRRRLGALIGQRGRERDRRAEGIAQTSSPPLWRAQAVGCVGAQDVAALVLSRTSTQYPAPSPVPSTQHPVASGGYAVVKTLATGPAPKPDARRQKLLLDGDGLVTGCGRAMTLALVVSYRRSTPACLANSLSSQAAHVRCSTRVPGQMLLGRGRHGEA